MGNFSNKKVRRNSYNQPEGGRQDERWVSGGRYQTKVGGRAH